MRRLAPGLTIIFVVAAVSAVALGLGGRHPSGKLGKIRDDWPAALLDLVNFEGRVHGHWVNANDEFFYQGDTRAFNAFLQQYANLKDTPLTVIVHTGPLRRSDLWGEEPRILYDWKLLVVVWGEPRGVTVDVWTDRQVRLRDVVVPAKVDLRSGTDIEAILLEMAGKGRQFNPDRLHKMGLEGLSDLLDGLLPETAKGRGPGLSRDDALRLLKDLGHRDFKTRELAQWKLIELGQPFADLVREAAEKDDPEIRLRARSVLSAWEKARIRLAKTDFAQYAEAFGVYVDGLAGDECLLELARRTRLALEKGMPSGGKRAILSHCLRAIAKSGNDKYCDMLGPLLRHKDVAVAVAVWVTSSVGSHSGNRYFPSLLIAALRSDRETVVHEAIKWTPNCWDRSRSQQVRRLLTAIFDGKNERLKFHACFPLMHGYGDKRAVAYILSQTGSPDRARARKAIYWIGDSCNHGRKVYPELLEGLVPLLQSDDDELRRAAAYALGTYSGEDVVKNLIPLLGDEQSIIVEEVSRKLLDQRDKDMLRRLLLDAEKTAENPLVRNRAQELLKKLQDVTFRDTGKAAATLAPNPDVSGEVHRRPAAGRTPNSPVPRALPGLGWHTVEPPAEAVIRDLPAQTVAQSRLLTK